MAGKIPMRSILGLRHIGDGDNAPAASLATAHKEELEQEPIYSGIYGLVVDDIVHHKVMEHDHEHGEDPQQLNGRTASTPPLNHSSRASSGVDSCRLQVNKSRSLPSGSILRMAQTDTLSNP